MHIVSITIISDITVFQGLCVAPAPLSQLQTVHSNSWGSSWGYSRFAAGSTQWQGTSGGGDSWVRREEKTTQAFFDVPLKSPTSPYDTVEQRVAFLALYRLVLRESCRSELRQESMNGVRRRFCRPAELRVLARRPGFWGGVRGDSHGLSPKVLHLSMSLPRDTKLSHCSWSESSCNSN